MATIRLLLGPFEGSRRSLAVRPASPPGAPPLVGFVALQSVVCNGVAGHRVPCSRLGVHRFRSALAVFHPSPSPAARTTGSSSRALPFPPESLEPPPARPSRAPPLGFRALIATSTDRVHARGRPSPASFRPRRFARPRRLAPLPALRVYFAPLPRPGFALQGFPLARSRTGSSPAVALLSFARYPCLRFPGGARATCSPSGPCSPRESVADADGLDRRPPDPLLSFVLPRVLLRAPRNRPSPAPPTTAFRGPRRVHRARPDLLLRACPPRSRFLA